VEDVTVDVQAPDEISAPVVTNTQVEENVSDNEVFIAVEDMPRYKGCEGIKDNDAAFECFQKEVGKFLGKNINYPQKAKEANVEGVVYVNFVVDQSGKVADVKLLRGIGFGCDEEATRVVKMLPQFTPGKQRGRAVKVSFNLPISFKLR
jgi:protein TonB